MPGGTMSLWPFFMGRFVELPYTLVQDYTLTSVLGETSPKTWLDKIDFLERYHGMALINSHPDYLSKKTNWEVYNTFLAAMKNRSGYWHALPREMAKWWRNRVFSESLEKKNDDNMATASLKDGKLEIDITGQFRVSRN
jgi:hypothetical protein